MEQNRITGMKRTQRKKRRKLKGYFTVEAALLMTLILPLLIALLLMGFYLHDQAKMVCIVGEGAAIGSTMRLYEDAAEVMEESVSKDAQAGMIWTRNVSTSSQLDEDEAGAQVEGSFRMPAFVSLFVTDGTRSLEKSSSRTLYRPAKLIRKVRGLKGLADILQKNAGE